MTSLFDLRVGLHLERLRHITCLSDLAAEEIAPRDRGLSEAEAHAFARRRDELVQADAPSARV